MEKKRSSKRGGKPTTLTRQVRRRVHALVHAPTEDAEDALAEDDPDDSPEVSDPELLHPECAYQQAIAAVREDRLGQMELQEVHAALRQLTISSDPKAVDALEYLWVAGAPLEPLPGHEPYPWSEVVGSGGDHKHVAGL